MPVCFSGLTSGTTLSNFIALSVEVRGVIEQHIAYFFSQTTTTTRQGFKRQRKAVKPRHVGRHQFIKKTQTNLNTAAHKGVSLIRLQQYSIEVGW